MQSSTKSSLNTSPETKPNLMLQLAQDEEEALRKDEQRNLRQKDSDDGGEYSNNGHSHDVSRSEMRGRILCWKRIVNLVGVSIFLLSIGIIALYFSTGLFDGIKIYDEVKAACSGADQDLNAMDKCEDKCADGMCCFASGTGSSCTEDLSHHCSRYSFCSILNSINSRDGEKVRSVNKLCSKGNLLTQEGEKECGKLCEFVSCCFSMDDDTNCYGDRTTLCQNFGECGNYYENAAMFGIGIGPVIIDPQGLDKKGGNS